MSNGSSRRRDRGVPPEQDAFLTLLKRMRIYLSEIGKGYAVARPMLRDGWRVSQVLWRYLAVSVLLVGGWRMWWHGLALLEWLVAF